MGINREQEKQITAVATTWLLEKKVVAVEPLRLYLAQYAELHLSDEDIAECLLHLLQGRRGDVQGLTLEQGFTFSMAMIGHWTSSYDILAIEVFLENRVAYAFYGVYEQKTKFIGVSKKPGDLLTILSERGIEIARWFPAPNFRSMMGPEAELEKRWEKLTHLVTHLYSNSTTAKVVLA